MQRTQKFISIRTHILGKLKLDQIEGNPICSVNQVYKDKFGKKSKRVPTIEEEIFSTKSIKIIKPYNSEKLINLQPRDYSICSVLKSSSYQKLQKQLTKMMSSFSEQKKELIKDIRNMNVQLEKETEKAGELCRKFMRLDENRDLLESEYFELKRENYSLRAQLNERRQQRENSHLWNLHLTPEPFQANPTIDIDNMSYEQILQMEERLGKHNVGLGKDKIAKLPVKKLKQLNQNDLNCCICCETLTDEENVIKLQCDHIHHAACIQEWLKIKRYCPLCKGEVIPI